MSQQESPPKPVLVPSCRVGRLSSDVERRLSSKPNGGIGSASGNGPETPDVNNASMAATSVRNENVRVRHEAAAGSSRRDGGVGHQPTLGIEAK